MPKTISPTLILDVINTKKDRHLQVEQAVEQVATLTRDEIADFATKLNLAVLSGYINLTPQEYLVLTSLTRKFIPDAPKEIKLEHTITPQQYLQEALTSNLDDYQHLQLQASEYAALEEGKTQELYDSLWKDATPLDDAPVEPTEPTLEPEVQRRESKAFRD